MAFDTPNMHLMKQYRTSPSIPGLPGLGCQHAWWLVRKLLLKSLCQRGAVAEDQQNQEEKAGHIKLVRKE